MMNQFEFHLNDLLTRVYRSVELMEEQMLRSSKNLNLSINEIHLLEAVGGGKNEESGRSISELSSRMGIRLPSVTAAVNKLAAKGYVEKRKAESDGRVVYVYFDQAGGERRIWPIAIFTKKGISSISGTADGGGKVGYAEGYGEAEPFFW